VRALVLSAIGRPGDVTVTGITTAVVMIAAALSPHDAWQPPLLRAGDTAVGIAIGLAASWLAITAFLFGHPDAAGDDGVTAVG
jgi:uncharacterized membrane protein YccC